MYSGNMYPTQMYPHSACSHVYSAYDVIQQVSVYLFELPLVNYQCDGLVQPRDPNRFILTIDQHVEPSTPLENSHIWVQFQREGEF